MSGFGPPPGPPEAPAHARRATYLPPGGLGRGLGGRPAAYSGRYALTRSAKPGIIPLAPLRLGDLLDGSVKHVRRNPGPVLGASALVNALAALPVVTLGAVAFAGSWLRSSRVSTVVDSSAVGALLSLGGTVFATLVLTAVLGYAAAEATLGRRHRLDAVWTTIRPRVWTVLLTQAIVVVTAVLPWALAVGMLAIAANESVPVLLLIGTGFGLLALAANLLLVPRMLYTGPAAVLERLTIGPALRRSWELSKGRFWSLVGVLLVVLGLAVILFWALELPQLLIYNLCADVLELPPVTRDAAGGFAFALANLGAAIVVTPFVATSIVLHYLDARMRKEGFDLALRRAAAADAEARS